MLHYYLHLPEIKGNIGKATAVCKTAVDFIEPFERYLKNAIDNLKSMENITAKWCKYKNKNRFKVELDGYIYDIPKENAIKLKTPIDGFGIGAEIFSTRGESYKVEGENNGDFILNELPTEGKKLLYNDDFIDYEIVPSSLPDNFRVLRNNDDRYIVFSNEKHNQYQQFKNYWSVLSRDTLRFMNGKKFDAEFENDTICIADYNEKEDGSTLVTDEGIKFKIKSLDIVGEKYRIQLIDNDLEFLNEEAIESSLKYFFDDDISIIDSNGEKYNPVFANESEKTLILRNKDNKSCFPANGLLTVKVNTYQLEQQKKALNYLKSMPIAEHKKIIDLFNDSDKVKWQKPDDNRIDKWFVLTDEKRDGNSQQREFVEKAINTPDFAILEGPPGSGKTTVILELICQIIRQGGRVLLCGSTHVAIDNVLERLDEGDSKSLINQHGILPVRIGDENRVGENVRKFQINNIVSDKRIEERLLLDVANLVCGTTIGILQNPEFKYSRINSDEYRLEHEPIVPKYDYLIIDESSKTTFHEFLVPALWAKKWILVGDTKQLSPFTDKRDLETNISNISINGKRLSSDVQDAQYLLFKLRELCIRDRKDNENRKYVVLVNNLVLENMKKELETNDAFSRIPEKVFVTNANSKSLTRLYLETFKIIVADIAIKNVLDLIPNDFVVLSKDPQYRIATEQSYRYNNFVMRFNKTEMESEDYISKREIDNDKLNNEVFYDKNWAGEIAWRLDREHQLVGTQKGAGNLSKAIEDLIPGSFDKRNYLIQEINNISSITLPSILESLVDGVKLKRKRNINTTITDGFAKSVLDSRHTILKFQHRMHPEISEFPRRQFYDGKALVDLLKPESILDKRIWKYDKYNSRSVWVDVNGKRFKGANELEAKEMMRHLNWFLDFADKNDAPKSNEPWSVACLTFYLAQEKKLRELLQKRPGCENKYSNFTIKTASGKKVNVKLYTVDKFQGHEADIVFLSMVQTDRTGFLDSPNRLNVAITRARFQLVVFGKLDYYKNVRNSEELKNFANSITVY